MQSIRIKSRIPLKKKEVEPVEMVQINIYQNNTFRKDLRRPHFDLEPGLAQDQQSWAIPKVLDMTLER